MRPTNGAVPSSFWSASRCLSLLLIVVVFPALFYFGQPRFPSRGVGFQIPSDPALARQASSQHPVFDSQIVSRVPVPEVHSPTLVQIANGGVLAFWYGGEREGAADTVIFSSKFEAASGTWSPARIVVDRATTQDHVNRFVKKLGNAVALCDEKGHIWLFYVSSMWGWSGSSINVIRSDDEGVSWTPARRIVTSPFLNFSTLVRGQPFLFADGTIGLPIYHEFLGKFCELLRMDATGAIIHKQRISSGRTSLQPSIVPISASYAVCAMRPAGSSPKQLLTSATSDGGLTWHPARITEVYSDYSGNATVRTGDDDLLTITREEDKLLFHVSKDGGNKWAKCYELDHSMDAHLGEGSHGPSYPCLLHTPDGTFHLMYSLERSQIRHVRFNDAWLNLRK